MKWEEECYLRRDTKGNPVSLVRTLSSLLYENHADQCNSRKIRIEVNSRKHGIQGFVNAASNIGNIIGQTSFGFIGDTFGRKFIHGKELIVCIFGTILVISLPNRNSTPTLKMIWVFCFRIIMCIGNGETTICLLLLLLRGRI
jgi:MFS family permease